MPVKEHGGGFFHPFVIQVPLTPTQVKGRAGDLSPGDKLLSTGTANYLVNLSEDWLQPAEQQNTLQGKVDL